MHLMRAEQVTDAIVSDVIARDCVLWITQKQFDEREELERMVALARCPWRAIFVESAGAAFPSLLNEQTSSTDSADVAGAFTHIIASDPVALVLQRRAKPVFFLHGLSDRIGLEASDLPRRSAQRRRLNMTARLRDIEARRVIVVGDDPLPALEDLAEMWDVDFRSLLTVVAPPSVGQEERIESVLGDVVGLRTVHWIAQAPIDFATAVSRRLEVLASKASLLLAVQLPGGRVINVDVANAELSEQPIADLCDFITVQDTLPVSPTDLREEEFRSFFTRTTHSWRSFSAGLPWLPDSAPQRELSKALSQQLSDAPGSVQVFSVVSEPGAGGTTQAQALAFAAARAGFPVLMVKQESGIPSALELTGFLFRAATETARQAPPDELGEPVWLLVLDVQHASRADELERLCGELSRSGRKVAILKVALPNAPVELPKSIQHTELVYVRHELDIEDVGALGTHLNNFLRNFGSQKALDEWMRFWQLHRPDIDTGIASFWIALEFWLAGFLSMGESIQSWVVKQFKGLNGRPEVQRAVLEIAAFAIERRAVPERLLSFLASPRLPWMVALGDARHDTPGLGLVEGEAFPYGRVWSIAHDVLARYLVNGIWNDRLLCDELAVPRYEDSVAMRLGMIAEVSSRPAMGDPFARQFAVSLATSVLKLDEQQGNAELFKHWRQVLAILEAVPANVRHASRTFNHHLAITKRRITYGELFLVEDGEKRDLLWSAARDVEFALNQIEWNAEDESDLNLLNTLALIYQDLADLERKSGNRSELIRLLAKSDEVTNRALTENPNSPYVLETAAKNLLRQGLTSEDQAERVEAASQALSYVFQASHLDGAFVRRLKLGQLADQALKALRDNNAVSAIDKLCARGSAYGFIAKAWTVLPRNETEEGSLLLDSVEPAHASAAIGILDSAPERNWLLVRLLYDLVVIADPSNFQSQLRLLDELDGTKGYQLSLQQVLERAVLLFITGQHRAAVDEFKWLRPRVKESHTIIFVPQRLRWLLTPDGTTRAVCSAAVIDSSASARGMAKVKELGGAFAPFNPQEFDKTRMAPNEQFKCLVTFAAMGPFLKPVDIGHKTGAARAQN